MRDGESPCTTAVSRVTLEYATPSGEVSPSLPKKKTGCLTTTFVCVCKPRSVSDCQRLQSSGYFIECDSDDALKGKLELVFNVVFVFVAHRPRVGPLTVGTVCHVQRRRHWHFIMCGLICVYGCGCVGDFFFYSL